MCACVYEYSSKFNDSGIHDKDFQRLSREINKKSSRFDLQVERWDAQNEQKRERLSTRRHRAVTSRILGGRVVLLA